MNWDAIGAIAETLGAVGVIASLVYLAGQIRHSREQMERTTLASQAAAYQQFFAHLNAHMTQPMQDAEYSEIIRVGISDVESLSEKDAYRFSTWMYGVCHAFDNALYQRRVGMLEQDLWEKHLADVHQLFSNLGIAQWWRATQPNLSPEFVALVEEILGEEPDRGE